MMKVLGENKIAIFIATFPTNFISLESLFYQAELLMGASLSGWQMYFQHTVSVILSFVLSLIIIRQKNPRLWVYGGWMILFVLFCSNEVLVSKMKH